MIEQKLYEYIKAIESKKSFVEAANYLGIAQSSLSRYIQKFEIKYGFSFFSRNPIKITEMGKLILDNGEKINNLNEQLEKKLISYKNNSNQSIKIGISPSRAPYYIPLILKNISIDSTVVIFESDTVNLKNKLISGDIDLMISVLDDTTKVFDYIYLLNEKINLVSSKKIKDIKEVSLIMPGKGQILEKIALSLNVNISKYQTQNIETAIALVKYGLGETLVPSFIKDKDLIYYDLSCLFGTVSRIYTRKICIFYRKEAYLSQSERELIATSIKIIKEFNEKG